MALASRHIKANRIVNVILNRVLLPRTWSHNRRELFFRAPDNRIMVTKSGGARRREEGNDGVCRYLQKFPLTASFEMRAL